MTKDNELKRKIEQEQYRRQLVEAELNAVTQSKAYKMAKLAGSLKNKIKSDPIGLTKKVARTLVTEPSKLTHLARTSKRISFMEQSAVHKNNKYQEWILLNEPDEQELDQQRVRSEKFAYKPLISIATPVYKPPVDVLEELIESVLNQTYPYFELCLWDDYGQDEAVIELLKKYAQIDNRIKFFEFTGNRGIAGASNCILEKAKGDYVGLLDHDDTLSLDALYENVKALNEDNYDFLYSDKDKIDTKNNRFDPLFKPQLSPEMLLNINYLTHFNLMRTTILREIGGWASDVDGAQDWDLFLRVVDASKKIAHIPKVLYHWRVIESSTAMSIETKPYALAAQRKAVDDHMKRTGIKAESYHQKTELFLRWEDEVLDQTPLVFIDYTNAANTLRVMRHVRKAVATPNMVVTVNDKLKLTADDKKRLGMPIVVYVSGKLGTAIKKYTAKTKESKTVLFIKDSVKLPKDDEWYGNLAGWVSIKSVAAASGRLVDRNDLIVDSGGVINTDGEYRPLFHTYPRYYESYIGNAEWVRDLSVISGNFFVTRLDSLQEYNFNETTNGEREFDAYCLWLTLKKGLRIVMSPHATATIYSLEDVDPIRSVKEITKESRDTFNNPNMNLGDPMVLLGNETEAVASQSGGGIDPYQHDAIILSNTFDITHQEIEANRKLLASDNIKAPESVAWVVPSFDAVYAGLMNIFSFANFLHESKGLRTTIYILKNTADASSEKKQVLKAFPGLKNAQFIGIDPSRKDAIKQHDIGIATQWATTYPLAKANNVSRKWYFIQDNETNFYPKGSISSLVELSYKFGFKAVANTDGLLDMYKNQYGGEGVVVKSVVDLSRYYPREDLHYVPSEPYRVFFYARPNMPRNAFELGVAGLKVLKKQLGDNVEIITAGADWDSDAYGVEGLFTNLGKIDYDAVPAFYRSIDAGLMFMFSGHPGVTASELMASGCPVVVNEYEDKTWHELYQHEKTCLVTKATASEIARNLQRCLEEVSLRKTLINNGLKKVQTFYDDYEKSQDVSFDTLLK